MSSIRFFSLIFSLLFTCFSFGQSYWQPIGDSQIPITEYERGLQPEAYQAFQLDLGTFKNLCDEAPPEFSSEKGIIVSIPMPDGSLERFELFETRLLQAGLSAKYPFIKAYTGIGVDQPQLSGRFDFSLRGFRAYIRDQQDAIIIDPLFKDNNALYQSFFRKDLKDREDSDSPFVCDVETSSTYIPQDPTTNQDAILDKGSPETEEVLLRTYYILVATTGEYSYKFGGTKESVLSEVANVINRVNSITERDLAIRFVIADNTDTLFFFDGDTDPYTNGNTGAMISENPSVISNIFPFNAYDVGHVLGTGGGGLAQLRSICSSGKARGVTSGGHLNGDQFYVDYVAHELGHQLGSNHTFNNCSGNENGGTAYEPGSGSTIMSYSGLCGSNNVQFDSYPYYHASSIDEITDYMILGGGNDCADATPTGNHFPVANIPFEGEFYIPYKTAFLLEGEATDEDGDSLTYTWEQYDLGPQSSLGSPVGDAPLFKYMPASSKPYRFFPQLQNILTGSPSIVEVLPQESRNLTFRMTVRDNNPAGGSMDWETIHFFATDEAGPFVVTMPGFSDKEWEIGGYAPVKWNVANTNEAPVNCQAVDIRLIDGTDYENSVILLENTPNDGEEYLLVPDMPGTNYRVIVEATDNVFLDASSTFHKIQEATAPMVSAGLSATFAQVCLPASEVIDIYTAGLGGYSGDVDISVTGDLPAGANVELSQTTITAGESAQLMVDFQNVTETGTVTLQVTVTGQGVDAVMLDVAFELFNFDFSALQQVSPENGASGISSFPVLTWNELDNALSYSVQIASSPSFASGTIIGEALNTTELSYQVTQELMSNVVYYWRVRAINECGEGAWNLPHACTIGSINCATTDAEDIPITITGNNASTIESVLNVPAGGEVNDVNIKNVSGEHSYFSDLTMTLIAPSGSTVLLVDSKCGNTGGLFNIKFDDEALNSNICPPSNVTVQPEEALSSLQGTNSQGEWTLRIHDAVAGSGGKLNSWSLELCSEQALNPPLLVTNEILNINDGTNEAISEAYLLANDADHEASDLIFTLVSAPINGEIQLDGIGVLDVGAQFSQADINAGALRYFSYGHGALSDAFYFSVTDGAGGIIPVTKFEIGVVVNTQMPVLSDVFNIYPNPVKDRLILNIADRTLENGTISIIDVAGKTHARTSGMLTNQVELDVRQLPSGTYFVQVVGSDFRSIEKFIVVKDK